MSQPTLAGAPSSDNSSLPGPRWNRAWVAPALILAGGVLVYANSFQGDFVLDEYYFIADNPAVKILRFWEYDVGSLRPVGFLTFALNYAVCGMEPWEFHAVNLAIHLATAGLLFALVRDTLAHGRLAPRYGSNARGLALAVALVWLVHPLQTQAVTYIYQRLESLMALFYLLTLVAFVRAQRSTCPAAWYVLSVVSCALGMGTKEVMITAPIAVLWYDRVFVAQTWRELLRRRLLYYTVLAGTWGVLAGLMIRSWPSYQKGGVLVRTGISPLEYALNEPAVVLHYLRLAFWPSGLCLEYSWPVSHDAWEIGPPLVAIVVLAAATLWAMVRWPAIGFTGGMFFLVLAPTSSVAPIKDLAYEHRMYLPLAALVILTVWAADGLWQHWARRSGEHRPRRRTAEIALVAGVLAALGIGTIVRNQDYRSALAFWQDNAEKRPGNPSARFNFAKYLIEAGEPAEALTQLNEAIRLRPRMAPAYANRGFALMQLKRYDESIRDYNRAIHLKFDPPTICNYRGLCYEQWGKLPEALEDYSRAIELKPGYADAYANRARCLFTQKQYGQAWADVRRSRQLGAEPDAEFLKNLTSASGHGG